MTTTKDMAYWQGALATRNPMLWVNPRKGEALPSDAPAQEDISEAFDRLTRCEPLMAKLFPELRESLGKIESPLFASDSLLGMEQDGAPLPGKCFLKRDDLLPIAGSIKARGGFHEVLDYAEQVARDAGLFPSPDGYRALASEVCRSVFAEHKVAVGSTGNLGLSIGIMAAALGFQTVVHMSTDAKAWKKDRLRQQGVEVVEHEGDYAQAVAAGRDEARRTPRCHFVDDEHSMRLFLGYAASAGYFAAQLRAEQVTVGPQDPLFVYLPCGVGGAPGGVTYGLKQIFGDNVHCFFAEPVESPCMLLQLVTGEDRSISVYDIGLSNITDADGLAVGQASRLVSRLMTGLVSGIFTVDDASLYRNLLFADEHLGVQLEPSATAGMGGMRWLMTSDAGQAYVREQGFDMRRASHVVWTTGGSLVPEAEYRRFIEMGHALR